MTVTREDVKDDEIKWNKWRKGESVKTLPLRTSGNNTIKIPSKVL